MKAANETHADCLRIITRAEIRMADEVDRGQAAEEIRTKGRSTNVRSADIYQQEPAGHVDNAALGTAQVRRDQEAAQLADLGVSKLTPSERAMFTRRRKDAYEALHPETRNGANQHNRVGKVCQPNFAQDTAAKTGQSDRTVRLDATRGERIDDDMLAGLRGVVYPARSSKFRTVLLCQAPPRAVRMPRAFSASAMARPVVMPLA